jgi:hypothetical protein
VTITLKVSHASTCVRVLVLDDPRVRGESSEREPVRRRSGSPEAPPGFEDTLCPSGSGAAGGRAEQSAVGNQPAQWSTPFRGGSQSKACLADRTQSEAGFHQSVVSALNGLTGFRIPKGHGGQSETGIAGGSQSDAGRAGGSQSEAGRAGGVTPHESPGGGGGGGSGYGGGDGEAAAAAERYGGMAVLGTVKRDKRSVAEVTADMRRRKAEGGGAGGGGGGGEGRGGRGSGGAGGSNGGGGGGEGGGGGRGVGIRLRSNGGSAGPSASWLPAAFAPPALPPAPDSARVSAAGPANYGGAAAVTPPQPNRGSLAAGTSPLNHLTHVHTHADAYPDADVHVHYDVDADAEADANRVPFVPEQSGGGGGGGGGIGGEGGGGGGGGGDGGGGAGSDHAASSGDDGGGGGRSVRRLAYSVEVPGPPSGEVGGGGRSRFNLHQHNVSNQSGAPGYIMSKQSGAQQRFEVPPPPVASGR